MVLVLVALFPLGWMLADMVLVARFLIQPNPTPKFALRLHIIGWGKRERGAGNRERGAG